VEWEGDGRGVRGAWKVPSRYARDNPDTKDRRLPCLGGGREEGIVKGLNIIKTKGSSPGKRLKAGVFYGQPSRKSGEAQPLPEGADTQFTNGERQERKQLPKTQDSAKCPQGGKGQESKGQPSNHQGPDGVTKQGGDSLKQKKKKKTD